MMVYDGERVGFEACGSLLDSEGPGTCVWLEIEGSFQVEYLNAKKIYECPSGHSHE